MWRVRVRECAAHMAMAAAARRFGQSRAALCSASLILGAAANAALSTQVAAAPPPPTAMDRLRQRAGIKEGKDPWGKPLGGPTRSRLAGVDVHALSTQPPTPLRSLNQQPVVF